MSSSTHIGSLTSLILCRSCAVTTDNNSCGRSGKQPFIFFSTLQPYFLSVSFLYVPWASVCVRGIAQFRADSSREYIEMSLFVGLEWAVHCAPICLLHRVRLSLLPSAPFSGFAPAFAGISSDLYLIQQRSQLNVWVSHSFQVKLVN